MLSQPFLMVVFVVPAVNHTPLHIDIMNSSLTDGTGLNMNDYFEELHTSDSVTYSEIQQIQHLNESKLGSNNLEYNGIHINIHSLPSKFEY